MLKLLLLQILAVSSSSNLAATRFETVTETSGTMGQAATTTRMQGTFAPDRLRVDWLGTTSTRSVVPAGSYMITAPNHFYVVDTAKKEYYDLDFAKMRASAGAMLKQMPGLQMKFSEFKFDAQDLGDGEEILSHPTRHWRVSGRMTMTGVAGQDTVAFVIETTADHFFAKDIEMPDSPLMSDDSAAILQFGDMLPAADAANMRAAMSGLPHTLDLRTDGKVTTFFGPMDIVVTSNRRVTRLEKVNVDGSFFDVPPGYKKVEMPVPAPPQRNF